MSAPPRTAQNTGEPPESGSDFYTYVAQITARVDEVRDNLALKYGGDALEELQRYFQSIAEDFTAHLHSNSSRFQPYVKRSEGRTQHVEAIVQAATAVAKQLEEYLTDTPRYSRVDVKQKVTGLSIALHNLLENLSRTSAERLAPLPTVARGESIAVVPSGDIDIISGSEPANTGDLDDTLTPDRLQAIGSVTSPADGANSTARVTNGVRSMLHQMREDAVERGAISDQSLRRRADDRLGYGVYVDALYSFIASPDTTTPLTIAIDGAWGSGKTSLMRMVQSELDRPWSLQVQLVQAWARLVWLVKFWLALPFWLIGVALLRFNAGTSQHPRWPNIRAGCSYDPAVHASTLLDGWPRSALFWARISAWRRPQEPPFHPTIWFNAWKFDQEEQLWAALAVEALRQIKQRYGPVGRFLFWLRLTWRRFTPLVAIGAILQRVAVPLLLGALALLYEPYLKSITPASGGTPPQIGALLPLGQWLLVAGGLITGAIQIAKIVKDPFQLSVNNFLTKPDYAAKVGFLGAFEADFAHIVAVATRRHLGWKPQKLVVFIDDLDRCEPPKSVDVIEAINLLLDSERCVFVIGMDAAAVVASIDTKYEKLFEKMRKETTGIASPGRFFLDKIIQVPFQMPSATEKHVEGLVASLLESRARPLVLPPGKKREGLPATENQGGLHGAAPTLSSPIPPSVHEPATAGPDVASYAREDVQNAIRLGAQLLAENPRQIKRFVNVFRLHVYIASKLGLFEEQTVADERYGLTLERLAVWVAWSIRWNDLAKHLLYEAQLQRSWLCEFLASIAAALNRDGSWITLQEMQERKLTFAKVSPEAGSEHAAPESVYQAVMTWVVTERKAGNAEHAPWFLLPWEWWLLKRDFLQGVKAMETFWRRPDGVSVDWFKTTLLMTRIDFETIAPVAPSNGVATPPNGAAVKESIQDDNIPVTEVRL